ncbi:hypothetical protein LCGC14_0015610 [marine sediment metagenome]|uniref:2Fe-2S ferredoxin-type domain-containing protein n=1 Tax=marine sediment metagenome TaxID=412755 RepID=A0A0F9W3Z1_9ZZZZ|nr:DUF4445 domain-containing protein [Phycisphaerae bacterium]HDZ43576.1 DUF4445 domain-containing protein [Phycisphaerae bacterium]
MTARHCNILFKPDGAGVDVPAGTTILAAAAKAGVFVNSLCGGDGVCGRCRVIVREGKVSGGSTEPFTHSEIQEGYILACEGRVESDLVVELPLETQLAKAPEYAGEEVPELTDVSRAARRKVPFAPLVRKTYLQLPPPDLNNNVSDLQRLELALGKRVATEGFQMGLKVTRRLPEVLRKSDWAVTAVTGFRGPLTEIIDVEAGDTSQRNMCIAADIGTTTVVCHLVDLRHGQTLGQAAKYNSQAAYGADVIRRIVHASENADKGDALRQAVIGDLNELIHELVTRYRLGRRDITLIAASGNTAMLHLLLSLPAESIRKEPYIGAAYRLPPFRAAEMGLQINPRGLLYCLPCVAGFVGADIVGGIYASGLAQSEEIRMLIDIGTNGEIVIGNRDFLVCASASAGPAFEGAECRCGMRATRGAIDHIRLADPQHVLSFSTISSAPPLGLSGTGYVDLVAEMLRIGVIDKTGRIDGSLSGDCVRHGDYGELEYMLIPADRAGGDRDILITQSDVNNILRAKGAVYAAASVLLKSLDMGFNDLAEIMVAGAFGNFLNLENAIFIGLLPDIPIQKLRFVGNTSLAGAKLAALSQTAYEDIFAVADRTTYFELSTDPSFMDQFVSACFFPHTHIELFPTVMAELAGKRSS